MAVFIDGFDYYNAITSIWDAGSSTSGFSAVGAGVFGYGRYVDTYHSTGARKTLPSNWSTLYFAFHSYMNNGLGDDTPWIVLYDGASQQITITISSLGEIKAWRGNKTTLLGTSTELLRANQWNWIAGKVTFNQSTGTIDIVVNGTTFLALSSQDTCATANEYVTIFKIGQHDASDHIYMDNFHLYDGSDAAPFNALLTERRIYFNFPTGDSASETDWTASSGNKYACLDENPGTTTDYIYSSTVGAKYGFTIADLPESGPDVVKLSGYVYKDDATARSIRLYNKQSATIYNGDTQVLSASAVYLNTQWLTNPAGGSWDKTTVDASEWGIELVA